MADEFKSLDNFFKKDNVSSTPPKNEGLVKPGSGLSPEEYFGKKENPLAPKPGLSVEKFFGQSKKPTLPNPTPDLYDSFSKSPEEAQRLREENIKRGDVLAALIAPYNEAMPKYAHFKTERNWQFYNNNADIGYKFHLNVKPENVRKVSEFLKKNDYEHKYLSGGDPDDGKVFTVYTGSKEQTELIVKEVADAIEALLEAPKAGGEIPYAPNIVGRFKGADKDGFLPYGALGIAILKKDAALIGPFSEKKGHQLAFTNAHKAALEKYGDYYGGGITYYQPQTITTQK